MLILTLIGAPCSNVNQSHLLKPRANFPIIISIWKQSHRWLYRWSQAVNGLIYRISPLAGSLCTCSECWWLTPAGHSPLGSRLSCQVGKASILDETRSISKTDRETISRDQKTSCHKGLSCLKDRPPAPPSIPMQVLLNVHLPGPAKSASREERGDLGILVDSPDDSFA